MKTLGKVIMGVALAATLWVSLAASTFIILDYQHSKQQPTTAETRQSQDVLLDYYGLTIGDDLVWNDLIDEMWELDAGEVIVTAAAPPQPTPSVPQEETGEIPNTTTTTQQQQHSTNETQNVMTNTTDIYVDYMCSGIECTQAEVDAHNILSGSYPEGYIIQGHNYKGMGSLILGLNVGDTVRIHGGHVPGTYVVVSTINSKAEKVDQLPWPTDYVLQTCNWLGWNAAGSRYVFLQPA